MRKCIFSLLIALAMILSLSVTAFAHDVPDMTMEGSICIDMGYSQAPEDPGSLTIIRVGKIQEENGNYTFVPSGIFTELWSAYGDFQSPALAAALADFAAENKAQGITLELSEDGTGEFVDLPLGLYLVVQDRAATGYEPIAPFLIGVPSFRDGEYTYQVDASPKLQPEIIPPETTEPSEPTTPTEPGDPNLPQTGQLNWPVPLLATAGLACLLIGWNLRADARKERYES